MRFVPMLLPCLLACPALAQSAGDPAAIVVTSSRTGEGGGPARITAEDLQRLQPLSLLDALDDVAGVHAVSTGGAGGGSFVSIRGGEPNFTLVLLDGVRVNDPTNSKGVAFDFTLIDPSLAQAVEVSRGAVSAVHGSDSLSGVINIRLRDATPGRSSATASLSGGTRGEAGGQLSLLHGWADGGLLLSAGGADSGDTSKGSTLHRWQALGRLHQQVGAYRATGFVLYSRNRHEGFPEDSGGPDRAVLPDLERGRGSLLAMAASLRHREEGPWRPHVSLSYSRQTSDTETPAIAPGALQGVPAIRADDRLERLEAIADLVFSSERLTATIGGALLHEVGESDGSIDFGFPVPADFRMKRDTASGFAEMTLAPIPGLLLNGAFRHDKVRNGPGEWTGRAGLSFAPGTGLPVLFARIGEGFKLPSFYALGSPLIGNPDLLPERSRNLEAGFDWAPAPAATLRLAWFDNRFRDLVDFDPVLFTSVNRERVRAHGVEASFGLRPTAALSLGGSLTRLLLDSETPLRQRPGWQGHVRGAWQATDDLGLNATLRFNSDFFDSSIPTGLLLQPGHAALDLGLGWRLDPRFRLDVVARNVTDSGYQQAVGFPAPGPTLKATLAATLF